MSPCSWSGVSQPKPFFKAFSPKRGLVFAVNGASAPPPPVPRPPPLLSPGGAVGGFTVKIPGRGGVSSRRGGGGEGQGCVRGIWEGGGGEGWRGPIYRENELPFRRKRLLWGFLGRPIFIQCGVLGGNCARPVRLPDPSPVLDKNRAPMGPEILSSTGAGVWRKAPITFPHSSSELDKF